jgi:hypothetical protein
LDLNPLISTYWVAEITGVSQHGWLISHFLFPFICW